jgi:DNA-binding GntR family transcriptional regulator
VRRLKSEVVYEELRARILSGRLGSGARLLSRPLATEFGVSDIPVREALWMLRRDGLVVNEPYAGCRVVGLSVRDAEEMIQVRGHLEALAASLAAEALTGARLEALDGHIEEMERAVEAADWGRYGELNRTFHETIYAACPNRRLRDLIGQLWDGQVGLRVVYRLVPDRLEESLAEHRQLVELLRAGDGAAAAELTLRHKEHVVRALQREMEPGEIGAAPAAETAPGSVRATGAE